MSDPSNPPPLLVGVVGPALSGKTTFARFLANDPTWDPRRKPTLLAFADPLKDVAEILFDLSHTQLYTSEGKATPDPTNGGLTPRQMLQRLGTDLVRRRWHSVFPELGPDSPWVRATERRIAAAKDFGTPLIVVHDVRFADEANKVRSLGGLIVRVSRPGLAPISESAHQSETEGATIVADHEISNASDEEALRRAARELLAELGIAPRPASKPSPPGGP